MSTPFYDLASLVVVPSGYKASKVYAQKPLTTDGQLAFSRASTATRVNASGLIETVASNVPRLDYLGSTCPKLQLEPQRTNSWIQSSAFDDAEWLKTELTVSANATTAPDGTTTADKIIDTTANNEHRFRATSALFTVTSATTFSIFAKAAEYSRFAIANLSAGEYVKFNLSTGAVISTGSGFSNAKIENYGNGWYRLSATTSTAATHGYGLLNDAGDFVFTGTGTKGVFIWGAQAEQSASYVSSFIPTTTAAVTRLADACSKTGISSLIGQTEGTLFAEIDFNGTGFGTDNDLFIYVGNGSNTNSMYIDYYNNLFRFVIFTGGSLTFYEDIATTNGAHKLALAYKSGSYAAYLDGVQIGVDTNAANPPTTSVFSLGGGATGFSAITKNTNQALLFKTRLTNAQLAELTTL